MLGNSRYESLDLCVWLAGTVGAMTLLAASLLGFIMLWGSATALFANSSVTAHVIRALLG
ncbi:MAG: hypothetical protein R3C05_27675 [Pirellulaceae bacterium]